MTQTEITTEMLHAFVDGQLNDSDAALVEAHLLAHPDRAAEVADWAMQNTAILDLFPGPDLPIELPTMAQPAPPQAANLRRTPIRAIAASISILAIGITLGWTASNLQTQNTEITVTGLVQQAINAHAVYTADPHRPVEVKASEEALLIRWLSNRIGEQLSAPDLSANGFDLVGGRLLSVADGPAAQFMYENTDGTRITLFATRAANSQMAEFTFKQNGKTNSFYWQDDRLRYAIIGDLPRADLNRLAIRIYDAFS